MSYAIIRNINFKDEIAVTNEEEKRILKLQRDFKAGLILKKKLTLLLIQ